jgi:hypothetical protein
MCMSNEGLKEPDAEDRCDSAIAKPDPSVSLRLTAYGSDQATSLCIGITASAAWSGCCFNFLSEMR